MGSCKSVCLPSNAAELTSDPSEQQLSRSAPTAWTQEKGDDLQASVDRIFGAQGQSLLGLEFSFTIADPFLEGCPLIGCSTGFTKLCGYELNEIVGRNCRFLIDPVPESEIDMNLRKHVRQYCQHAKDGKEYRVPAEDREDWMPVNQPADELLAFQKNARKDGSLFWNMFLLKTVLLGADLGEEARYIVGLQSELPEGKATLAKMAQNIQVLASNMDAVLEELAAHLFVQVTMKRQDEPWDEASP